MEPRALIPVIEAVETADDAGGLLARLADLQDVTLLDSGGGGRHGRTSILAVGGYGCFTGRSPDVARGEGPFEDLRRHLGCVTVAPDPRWPFTGGLVGWFGYDVRLLLERLPDRHPRDQSTPDWHFVACRVCVLRDEATGETVVARLEDPGDDALTSRVRHDARVVRERLTDPARRPVPVPPPPGLTVTAPPAEDHVRAVARALDHLRAGDVYQVNVSQRFSAPAPADTVGLYRRLREENPPTFGAFQAFPGGALLSVSPERFLSVDRSGGVRSRPVKGTARRDADPDLDRLLAEGLLASPKDRAELAMIVDVLRNDLSRVCVPGSVSVPEAMVLETHPTVHHLVAEVAGTLEAGRDRLDLLAAALPGGSITGAPRIRAMQIIDELEACRRGPYTGAFGYLGYDGRMDTNVLIRTVVIVGDRLTFHGGGGIVIASDPEGERRETVHKVMGILRALGAETPT